ncbi:MAG TPA: GntR family transcriptional regulator [Anaeromyxobacteraceae bacterium]|nr:GntR family transcriptional regulator [Anaeromyxobacteraceae bacterium]
MPERSGAAAWKHRQIYAALEQAIRAGRWRPGERLPSEAELVRQFGASRITVGRAVRDLQLAGLVDRRAGSGTFVRREPASRALSFGMLVPELGETEIFEAIWRGIASSPLARGHALLWGATRDDAASKEDRAWELCRQYVERRVSGVFFAPLELVAGADSANRRITAALDDARIPVVLLDRTAVPYPDRGHHDLVGLDNLRAGYVAAEHLLASGARRVAFAARPHAAATVAAREAGYREALHARGLPLDPALSWRLEPADAPDVARLLAAARPDGIVCANDWTAARMMRSLLALGVAVPRDVRLVGVDDVEYASLLPVPLTTVRQPARQIGAAALAAMLDRVAGAELPTRDILLHGTLVVRASSGASPAPAGPVTSPGA